MHTVRGSTRLLLVSVLAAAAVLLGVSVVVLLRGDAGDDFGDDGGGEARFVPTGDVEGRPVRERVSGEGDPDEGDGVYEWEVGPDGRMPHGDVFAVTHESLRAVLADRHWEEIRRQIDVLQRNGGEVPMDVVEALIALLDGEDTRIDAMLALGGVQGDAPGTALAQHAADLTVPLEVRAAALDALAKNGSKAALTLVQALASDPNIDPRLLRHACPALAGIGGQDAARTLLELLTRHQDTRLEGMIVQALGKTRGAGDVLAQSMRQARDSADADMALLVVRVARLNGAEADDAVRLEIRRLVEDPTSREFVADENDRLKLRGAALSAAAAIGGDLLDPVVGIARNDTDGLARVALHCLRQARGDEAATKVAPLLDARDDPAFRREVAVVLGETRSFQATEPLVQLLDDADQNTRHAAAYGLAQVRDPAATKALLDHLDASVGDQQLGRNLVEALGTIGANEALPRLRELRESDDPHWEYLRPWVRNAIARIESGNPETTRME